MVPVHIGIIMDGNGRWAESRGQKRSHGHKVGSKMVERIATHAFNSGVKVVTVYAFSTENFGRPKDEVDTLMKLLDEYLVKLTDKAVKNKIKIQVLGDRTALSASLNKTIDRETAKTAQFNEHVFNICINYGGRQEIITAVKNLVKDGKEVTDENLQDYLYTKGMPPLDLIIRTGGELRLSNFMTYQSVYSEFYFTDVLWPDFDENELDKALEAFANRKRRYGKV